jgi:hypothetical protein
VICCRTWSDVARLSSQADAGTARVLIRGTRALPKSERVEIVLRLPDELDLRLGGAVLSSVAQGDRNATVVELAGLTGDGLRALVPAA